MVIDKKELAIRFTYHRPNEKQIPHYEKIRDIGRYFALEISERCPNCREKSLAITKIEEAVMWANAAIARGPR